jgi:hypothetical protein
MEWDAAIVQRIQELHAAAYVTHNFRAQDMLLPNFSVDQGF